MSDSLLHRHKPDILDCIANLSNDEVFTPPVLANRMLDLLPPEVWTNPDLRFLDPGCKSGVFLREAAKRLMAGLAHAIRDEAVRREHIFKNMLHGIAITELTAQISRRTLYYSKDASSEQSVVQLPRADGNIRYRNIAHTFKSGSCVHCGAPEAAARDLAALESHAYLFLHEYLDPTMKFDVIIGNPPYQLKDGGHGASASPLYHKFVQQAMAANPQYISMIIPSRWFAGGKGMSDFREKVLKDEQFRVLVDYTDAKDCFPGVDISGGVCYFLWARNSKGDCTVITNHAGNATTSIRALDDFDTFVRFSEAVEIIHKVRKLKEPTMDSVVSSHKPFGLRTNARPQSAGELSLVWNNGVGPFPREEVPAGRELIDKWKVITSRVSYDHAGQSDKNGQRRVFSRLEVLPPKAICTETYLVVGVYETEQEATNTLVYLKSKFVRFLVAQLAYSQDFNKDKFALVPILDMTAMWTDEKLYKRYCLSDAEVAFIESMIKEMV